MHIDRAAFGSMPVFFSRTFCQSCHILHEWFAASAWVCDCDPANCDPNCGGGPRMSIPTSCDDYAKHPSAKAAGARDITAIGGGSLSPATKPRLTLDRATGSHNHIEIVAALERWVDESPCRTRRTRRSHQPGSRKTLRVAPARRLRSDVRSENYECQRTISRKTSAMANAIMVKIIK